MKNYTQLKILQQVFSRKDLSGRQDYGFTMVELLVVIIIVGILSAIAAPSWLAYTNRQRIGSVNNAVFRALQDAQSEAKRTKKDYTVSFQNSNQIPQVAVYQGDKNSTPAASQWKSLAQNQNIGNTQFSSTQKVTFDYMGTVQQTTPLKVTVLLPNTNLKRCVVVETILGGMRTAEGTGCL